MPVTNAEFKALQNSSAIQPNTFYITTDTESDEDNGGNSSGNGVANIEFETIDIDFTTEY